MTLCNAKEAFAVPGESNIIDCINPATGRSWIEGETLDQIRQRYPLAEQVNLDAWVKAKGERQDCPILWTETTEDRYMEMLEVLPPAYMSGGAFLVGEPWDHHAINGQPRFQGFIHRGDKYFVASRPMTRVEMAAFVVLRKPLMEAA